MLTESPIDCAYTRVIPRDLFNESKLLKCIGQLALLVHDNNNLGCIESEHDGDPFIIGLVEDGSLTVTNIQITVKGIPMLFKTTYNNKAPYPLLCEYRYNEYPVFEDDGAYTTEFTEFCNSMY